ncbi:MAG TPA: hypothetical protein VJR89_15760, partial [Polyangiales bacterium]|nr:hypothetical protein [Polyangiales bacterium]
TETHFFRMRGRHLHAARAVDVNHVTRTVMRVAILIGNVSSNSQTSRGDVRVEETEIRTAETELERRIVPALVAMSMAPPTAPPVETRTRPWLLVLAALVLATVGTGTVVRWRRQSERPVVFHNKRSTPFEATKVFCFERDATEIKQIEFSTLGTGENEDERLASCSAVVVVEGWPKAWSRVCYAGEESCELELE